MPQVEAESHMASMSALARSMTQTAKIAVAGQHVRRASLSVLTALAMRVIPEEMGPRTVHACLEAVPLPVKPAAITSHVAADIRIRRVGGLCLQEGRVLNVRRVYRTLKASVRRKRRVSAVMNLRGRVSVQLRMAHVLWRVLADLSVANAIQANA
jgi:hypothetical protein